VTDVGDGNTGGNGSGNGGVTDDDNNNGTVPYIKAEPTAVAITFASTATNALNGVDGVRPVAATDLMTATITPAEGASRDVADYTFLWKVGGTDVGTAGAGVDTFTADPTHQGLAVSVDVMPKS
ncbi:hypothetical protein, partial [Aeromonas hydrophila]|uniref:hypothetical protein n=1 Tax=Aeromonas hydrophila TaxID=644 RepID=UPI003EC8EF1C